MNEIPNAVRCDNCPFILGSAKCTRFHASARGERVNFEIIEVNE